MKFLLGVGGRLPNHDLPSGKMALRIEKEFGVKMDGVFLSVKSLFDSKHFLVPLRQTEDSEDSALVDDAYLNVRLVVKSRAPVELLPFHKECSDRLVGQN